MINRLSRCKPYLGTLVEVTLEGACTDDELIECSQLAFESVAAIDREMSFHNCDSELSKINRFAYSQSVAITEPMQQVLSCALALSAQSDGLFDVSVAPQLVSQGLLPDHQFNQRQNGCWKDIELGEGWVRFHQPMLLDLGGIAKGYAVDRVFESLKNCDLSLVVNAGGDLRMSHWQGAEVSIRHPSLPNQLVAVEMRNCALATSAHYFLGSWLEIDAEDGAEERRAIVKRASACLEIPAQSAFDGSVSVFSNRCMLSDALTKVAMLSTNAEAVIAQLGGQLISLSSDF